MKQIVLGALILVLTGCGSSGGTAVSAEAALMEKPGALPPDRTALRVAQQCAPDGLSNQLKLLLLHQALVDRDKAPVSNWEVAPQGDIYVVKATLAANDRPTTTFVWHVDFRKPAAGVCKPANQEAALLDHVKCKLDESNLKSFLDGPGTPGGARTPTPAETATP